MFLNFFSTSTARTKIVGYTPRTRACNQIYRYPHPGHRLGRTRCFICQLLNTLLSTNLKPYFNHNPIPKKRSNKNSFLEYIHAHMKMSKRNLMDFKIRIKGREQQKVKVTFYFALDVTIDIMIKTSWDFRCEWLQWAFYFVIPFWQRNDEKIQLDIQF